MSLTWPSLSRELLRLWLRSEEKAYALPFGLRDDWQHIYYSLTSAEHDFFPPESTLSSPIGWREAQESGCRCFARRATVQGTVRFRMEQEDARRGVE